MDHSMFNYKSLPLAHGLSNSSSLCWFNSFLQSMLSLTSLTDLVLGSEYGNEVLQEYRKFVRAARENTSSTAHMSLARDKLYRVIQTSLAKKPGQTQFTIGYQHDQHEIFTIFLDLINSPSVYRLFNFRTKSTIMCSCQTEPVVNKTETNTYHALQKSSMAVDLATRSINSLLQISEQVCGFTCPRCQSSSEKTKTDSFTMVPEVLVFRTDEAWNTLPAKFTITGSSDVCMTYQCVAQVSYSGARSSNGSCNTGHYTARVLRADPDPVYTQIVHINDSTCNEVFDIDASLQSNMCYYHITDYS